MKYVLTALVSAVMLASAPAIAGSHGGGKMDPDGHPNSPTYGHVKLPHLI